MVYRGCGAPDARAHVQQREDEADRAQERAHHEDRHGAVDVGAVLAEHRAKRAVHEAAARKVSDHRQRAVERHERLGRLGELREGGVGDRRVLEDAHLQARAWCALFQRAERHAAALAGATAGTQLVYIRFAKAAA